MKIAFVFGPYSIGNRPLDFSTLWTSDRGLTGSELGIVMNAQEMVKLGHDVSFFTTYTGIKPELWNGVKIFYSNEIRLIIDDTFDAIVSYNEPDIFRVLPSKPLRVVSQMLNDFSYCAPGFDEFVDIYTSPCQMHMDYVKQFTPNHSKWKVLPLGCDPTWYTDNRVPGRVVWTSSADRGLHLLLQEWPQIKASVPNAYLKIFYNFNFDHMIRIEPDDKNNSPIVKEMANRARYIKEAIKRLKHLGVEMVGSISRKQMQKELSEAMVLAYPTSTVSFTEGFSISIMEACASGTLPVISDCDCLGSIYGGYVPMAKSPIKDHMAEFTEMVIKGLVDEDFRSKSLASCKEIASKHTWTIVTKKLEQIIKQGKP